MILLISTCTEKLHELEFVKPISDIIKKDFRVINYSAVTKNLLKKADKIIICGTGLQDNVLLENLEKFQWIKNFDKPLLGICAGMQLICLTFGARLKKEKEIGYFEENFVKEFLGLKGKQKVYHLHNYAVTLPENFEQYNSGKIPQTVKHKSRPIYGVLFHPKVRNKELIENFINL